MAGLVVSIVGLVGLVFGVVAGLLVARLGTRPAMLGALVAGAALSLAQAALPPLPVMLALRVLEGVSHLAIVVVGPVVMAAAVPGRGQGLAMTLWSTFFGIAFALMAWLAPLLPDLTALFFVHAGWMLACALALGLLMPGTPGSGVALAGGWIGAHLRLYADPRVAAPALGFVWYTAAYLAVLTLVPPLLDGPARAWAAAGMPLVSIAASLMLGVSLLGRVGPVGAVQAGYALGAAAGLAFLAAPTLAGALLLAAGLGVVQGASFAAIPALNPAPEARARAAGAIAQMGNVGTTLGTPVLAAMLAGMGPVAVAVFAVPLCLAGIALHLALARRRGGG
jgi:predicted MFS family arabinose efflux permease